MGHFLFNIVNFHPEFIYLFIYVVICFISVYSGLPWFVLFVLVLSHILYFCCLWVFWVFPVHFCWLCLVWSLWNSHWLLAGFLFSECSCGLCWVPWYSFSLFCWSLNLCIHFLHFPLVPLLICYWGKMVSILFPSSLHTTWWCYCPCTVCNLV
jgi:hypothetical protein